MDRLSQLVLLCGAASLGAALIAVALLLLRMRQVAARRAAPLNSESGRTIFLTEGRTLLDMTDAGQDFLTCRGSDGTAYDGLERALIEIFPDFAATARRPDGPRTSRLISADGMQALTVSREGPRSRLELADAEEDMVQMDRGCHATLEAELAALRAIGDGLPYPIWRQNAAGQVQWVNSAYLALLRARDPGDAATWPPAPLFGRIDPAIAQQRVQLSHRSGADGGWYDCNCVIAGADALISATPADALMAAETSLRDSIQTFSRTFAHLTVGMAVFDKLRRLQLFNPALTDLTTLPVDLLIARPTLDSFLDALRARKMMPEPKTYTSWREAVARLERAAVDGTYSEMWHLPGTRTYRVTGRPQPGGAFALLIEDISAEISLTRRFRTQIQTGQAVLDTLDDAIGVFDVAGILVVSNAAYDRLWDIETQDGVTQLTARDALATWTALAPSPLWDGARDYLSQGAERETWSDDLRMRDGRTIGVVFTPLPGGATVVRFTASEGSRSSPLLPKAAEEAIRKRLGA